MSETITCTPEELPGVMEAEAERMVADYREHLAGGVALLVTEIAAQAPKLSGDFAASVQSYVGEPGATWERGGGGNLQSGAEAAATVVENWKPGDETGAATDAPYSRKLIFHAGENTGRRRKRRDSRTGARKGSRIATYTRKVSSGWVDRILEEVNRFLEGA